MLVRSPPRLRQPSVTESVALPPDLGEQPHTNRILVSERLYNRAELIELRRQMLRYSRSIPPGPARNDHLQIAISLGRLFKDKDWFDAHTVEGMAARSPQLAGAPLGSMHVA